MAGTFVHGYVTSAHRARGLARALLGAGFAGRDIELRAEAVRPALEAPAHRRDLSRDVRNGAVLGALSLAPLGPVVPGLFQAGGPPRLWAFFAESPLLATVELTIAGGLCGAIVGFFVGRFRAQRAAEDERRYFVGVHARDATVERAIDTMQQMGSAELDAEPE